MVAKISDKDILFLLHFEYQTPPVSYNILDYILYWIFIKNDENIIFITLDVTESKLGFF